MVERGSAGRGAPLGAAEDAEARPGGSLDHRRHGDPEEGPAFGGRGAAVLWTTGEAGELPGECESERGRLGGVPASGLAAVPAAGVAGDGARRRRAGVPVEVDFDTQPEIALERIGQALEDGVAAGVVLADAGYGTDTRSRESMEGKCHKAQDCDLCGTENHPLAEC